MSSDAVADAGSATNGYTTLPNANTRIIILVGAETGERILNTASC